MTFGKECRDDGIATFGKESEDNGIAETFPITFENLQNNSL